MAFNISKLIDQAVKLFEEFYRKDYMFYAVVAIIGVLAYIIWISIT